MKDPCTINKFKVNCNQHLVMNEYASGYALKGILGLNLPAYITLSRSKTKDQEMEPHEPKICQKSLRDYLMQIKFEEKTLFSVIAETSDGRVEAIVASGKGREAETLRVGEYMCALVIYDLLFERKADPHDMETALKSWSYQNQVHAAMYNSRYDCATGEVTIQQKSMMDENDPDVDILSKGLLGMLILKDNREIEKGIMEEGEEYDSNRDDASRASETTQAFRYRIMGFEEAVQHIKALETSNPDKGAGMNDGALNEEVPAQPEASPPSVQPTDAAGMMPV